MPEKKLCGAKRNKREGTCTLVAGYGTDHVGYGKCKFHLGSTKNMVRAAQKEIARDEVKRLRNLAILPGEPVPDLDPKQVLAEELYRSQKAVRDLDEQINALAEIHGPMFHATGIRTGESKPHVVWVMWQEQRSHLKLVSDSCHKAGIDVARVQLEKQRVDALVTLFNKVWDFLELTAERRVEVNQFAASQLRLLQESNP